jgi:hypothetical protein
MEYGRVMSGWGRVSLLIAAGMLLGAGCGGRTGALEGEYGAGADGSGAEAGAISLAGASSVAGRGSRGGAGNVAGGVSVAGRATTGGTGIGYGGAYPGGGYPVAGYGGTGIYPQGGYSGFGIAGTGFSGTFSTAGYGGYAFGGAYPQGGFATAGQGPQSCAQCLLQSCSQPFGECLQDFGCLSILSCVQATGCQAFQCYSDNYCRDTIDQWGGPAGQSMSEILQTFACAVKAGCSCN